MAGQLSAVNLIAGAGILGNVGGVPITANAYASNSISTFNNLAVEVQFANVKNTGNAVLTSNTMIALNNLGGNIFPAVTNAVPSAYIGGLGNTPLNGLTGLLDNEINNIVGNGDLGIFDQVLGISGAYALTTNLFINSAVNANNASQNATYINQDNVATGGLSQLTEAFAVLGQDLQALGVAIDLENLSNIGSPEALLQQIYTQTNGSTELNTVLLNAGLSQTTLNNIGLEPMTDEQQKIVYDAMTKITGSTLTQILKALRVSTANLTTLADLLNPVKAFPKSFVTLTAPTANGIRAIYINDSGAVNTNLETELPSMVLKPIQGYQTVRNTYSQLKKIIPADYALAYKAIQAALEQVKSVFNSTIALLGTASLGLESNKGLDLINALTQPLPTEVYDFYITSYATGTGKNNTILIADVIGTAGGWVVNGNLPAVTNVVSTLTSSGALNTLTNGTDGVFTVMQNTIDGDYGSVPVTIPVGLPGAGTYDTLDLAFTGPGNTSGIGLIPAAYSLINTVVTNNTANVAVANSAWANVAAQLLLEQTNQVSAGLIFGNLIAGQQATSLVTSLSQYGLDTTLGGAAWLLESVANTSTLGGQAIVSSMREARNQVLLQNAGVATDIIVDNESSQYQSNNLSSGQYTVAEATAQKII